MTTRRLSRTYAIGDLEAMDVDPSLTDTEAFSLPAARADLSEGDSTEQSEPEPDIPVKQKCGPSAGSKNKSKPKTVNHTEKGVEISPEIPPGVVTRTLPVRLTRVVDPAGPDRPRPKRTSAEVKAANARKAQLRQELRELNERKVQAIAEMDVQEDLEDEDERIRTNHITNTASMDSNDVDDINADPPGGEQENSSSDVVSDSEPEVVQADHAAAIVPAKTSVGSQFQLVVLLAGAHVKTEDEETGER
jgi:hypothetical protein